MGQLFLPFLLDCFGYLGDNTVKFVLSHFVRVDQRKGLLIKEFPSSNAAKDKGIWGNKEKFRGTK